MTGEQFSTYGRIENNIELLKESLVDEGTNQLVVLVVGKVNTAKTSLSLLVDNYLNDEVNLDTYCLNHEDFKKQYTSRPLKKFIVYEEGRDSFDRNKHNHKSNTEARDMLNQFRKYQHIVFINFQNASDLQPDLVNNNAHGMLRCTKKGRVHGYGKQSMRSMWVNRYFQGWDDPDFTDSFPDPANKVPGLWNRYEERALQSLDSRGEEEIEEDSGEDSNFLSTRTVADRLDLHINTVRNWIDDGKFDAKKLPNGQNRIPEKQVKNLIE